MSVIVKSIDENNKKMILELDNGDFTKLQEAMGKWSFKDHQSLLQFMVSLSLQNGRSSFTILLDGAEKDVVPASDLINKKN